MLIFLVPLKSAQVSNSWQTTSKLFERCVSSLCRQTISEFKVITICHEKPEIKFEHSNLEYIEVDFPIPTWKVNTDHKSRELDKQKKIYTGLIFSRQFYPSYIMLVDADDCVSKHLAEFVKQNSCSNGWFFNRGWEYQEGAHSMLHRDKNFHQKCGTSFILRQDLIMPESDIVIDNIDHDFLYHQCIVNLMEKRNMPLEPLPFEGAIYIIDNGENYTNQKKYFIERFSSNPVQLILYYARRFYKSLKSQSITQSICDEFGLYNI